MDPDTRSIIKVIVDVACILFVGLPILMFYLFGQPYQRGFYCNDESIRYPYKDSTVPNVLLYFVGLVVPICTITVNEYFIYRSSSESLPNITIFGRRIPYWLFSCYKTIGVFGFGAACSQLITDIGKYSIGRLRPHFWAVCQPSINCNDPSNMYRYIVDFDCIGRDKKMLRDARLSFPSGHSSFSAYTMVYLAIYIHYCFNWRGSYLVKHVIQFVCISIAWATALSRVSNYKHHWSDVTIGILIGSIVAIVVARYVSDLAKRRREREYFCHSTDLASASQAMVKVQDDKGEV